MGNEKLSGRDKMSKTMVILYIASAIMGILFIYMFIEAAAYISDYMDSYGLSFGDMWSYAVQYVLSSSVSYIAFGLLLFAAGRILDVLQRRKAVGSENITEEVSINLIEEKSEEAKEDKEAKKDETEDEGTSAEVADEEETEDKASEENEEAKKDDEK